MENTINVFTDGLQIDSNALSQSENTLSDALNATLLTFNGNEMLLQNDMGNTLVQDSTTGSIMGLSDGFVPIGMKEHGGILYIASLNKDGVGELGTIPSPLIRLNYNDKEENGEGINIDDLITENDKYILVSNNKQYFNKLPTFLKFSDTILKVGDVFLPIINTYSGALPNFEQEKIPLFSTFTSDGKCNCDGVYNVSLKSQIANGSIIDVVVPPSYDEGMYWFEINKSSKRITNPKQIGYQKYPNIPKGKLGIGIALNLPDAIIHEKNEEGINQPSYTFDYKNNIYKITIGKPEQNSKLTLTWSIRSVKNRNRGVSTNGMSFSIPNASNILDLTCQIEMNCYIAGAEKNYFIGISRFQYNPLAYLSDDLTIRPENIQYQYLNIDDTTENPYDVINEKLVPIEDIQYYTNLGVFKDSKGSGYLPGFVYTSEDSQPRAIAANGAISNNNGFIGNDKDQFNIKSYTDNTSLQTFMENFYVRCGNTFGKPTNVSISMTQAPTLNTAMILAKQSLQSATDTSYPVYDIANNQDYSLDNFLEDKLFFRDGLTWSLIMRQMVALTSDLGFLKGQSSKDQNILPINFDMPIPNKNGSYYTIPAVDKFGIFEMNPLKGAEYKYKVLQDKIKGYTYLFPDISIKFISQYSPISLGYTHKPSIKVNDNEVAAKKVADKLWLFNPISVNVTDENISITLDHGVGNKTGTEFNDEFGALFLNLKPTVVVTAPFTGRSSYKIPSQIVYTTEKNQNVNWNGITFGDGPAENPLNGGVDYSIGFEGYAIGNYTTPKRTIEGNYDAGTTIPLSSIGTFKEGQYYININGENISIELLDSEEKRIININQSQYLSLTSIPTYAKIAANKDGYFRNFGIYKVSEEHGEESPTMISAICFKECGSCLEYEYNFKHYPDNPMYRCEGWYYYPNGDRTLLSFMSPSGESVELVKHGNGVLPIYYNGEGGLNSTIVEQIAEQVCVKQAIRLLAFRNEVETQSNYVSGKKA